MTFSYHVERWREFARDAQEIFKRHWAELALDQDVIDHVAPDHERYLKIDELGMLHITTVRADGALIGYAVNFLHHHFHYKDAGLMAVADMYYLLPEYRKGAAGIRLFVEMEKNLRALGVVRAHTSCKVHQDHETLFARLGWQFTDKTFSKVLKGK